MINAQAKNLDIYEAAKQRAFDNPRWFFDHIIKFPLLNWQYEAINAVFDVRRKILGIPTVINHKGLPRVTIRSCHGTGKTQFLAALMHIWNFTSYGKIACTAPKEAQLTKRLLPRYRTCMKAADLSYRKNIKVQGKEVVVFKDKDWGAVMETASDPDNLAGYHDTPQLFLVDEGSAKKLDPMYPVIEGALTTPGSVVVEIGNPTRPEGEFHAHHNKPAVKELYFRMHIKHTDAPELITQQWVDTMRIKYGEDSPVFKIRVLGEFADMSDNQIIALAWLDAAQDIDEETDGSIPRLKIAADVADGGLDFSVITVAREYDSFTQMVKQTKHSFPSSESPILVAKECIKMFNGYGGNKDTDTMVIDSIGVGAGTAGYLMDKGYKVKAHKGGSTVGVNTKKYRNQRTMAYISFRDAHRDAKIRYSPDFCDDWDEYIGQVCSIKSAPGDKVDDIETKKSLTDSGAKSPDRADSGSMIYSPSHTKISSFLSLNNDASTLVSSQDM